MNTHYLGIGAVLAAVLSTLEARADIVHVPFDVLVPTGQEYFIEYEQGPHYFYLRFNVYEGTPGTLSLSLTDFLPGTPYGVAMDGAPPSLLNLPPGAPVGPSLLYGSFGVASGIDDDPHFEFIAGIHNLNFGEAGTYAWLRLAYTPAESAVTIVDFAYETNEGVPIPAGAVPPPGTFIPLVLAGSFATCRRNRTQ